MTTANITATVTAGSLDNAGRTVMNWLRALLGTTPSALAVAEGSKSQPPSQEVPSYYKVGVRLALLRRADELDAVSPHEAAALRQQAAAI